MPLTPNQDRIAMAIRAFRVDCSHYHGTIDGNRLQLLIDQLAFAIYDIEGQIDYDAFNKQCKAAGKDNIPPDVNGE